MDGIEVLAHITAPSGFQDDKRYLAQAAAVAGFESCSRLAVYGANKCLPELNNGESFSAVEEETAFETSSSFPVGRQTDAAQENPPQKATRQLPKELSPKINPKPSICRRSTVAETLRDRPRPLTWKISKCKVYETSPRFKTPSSHGEPATPTVHAAREPEFQRLKTAPSQSIASNPSALRKRARSEFPSFDSPRSFVPDSLKKPDLVPLKGHLCTKAYEIGCSGRLNDSITYTALSELSVKPQARPTKRQQVGEAGSLSHQSEIPNPDFVLRDPGIPPRAQQERLASFEFSNRATTSSDSDSMWPPQPQPNLTYPPPPEQISSSQAHGTASRSVRRPRSQAEAYDDWLFSQTPSSAAKEHPFPHHGSGLPLSSISSLPNAVHAPTPPVGHAHYTTHLTSSLLALATRLPLASSFRPVLVRRDINVLERGYWHLPIPVSPSFVERQGRSGARNGECSRSRDRPWTEPEFLQFWHALAGHVRNGGSGWGVTMYREPPDCTRAGLLDLSSGKEDSNPTINVFLKVTCWGEILGHVYLVMWVLSDKKTEALQMEWRDGGEEVVVKMGCRQREGRLGAYGFKGGKGAKGVWGIIRGDKQQSRRHTAG